MNDDISWVRFHVWPMQKIEKELVTIQKSIDDQTDYNIELMEEYLRYRIKNIELKSDINLHHLRRQYVRIADAMTMAEAARKLGIAFKTLHRINLLS